MASISTRSPCSTNSAIALLRSLAGCRASARRHLGARRQSRRRLADHLGDHVGAHGLRRRRDARRLNLLLLRSPPPPRRWTLQHNNCAAALPAAIGWSDQRRRIAWFHVHTLADPSANAAPIPRCRDAMDFAADDRPSARAVILARAQTRRTRRCGGCPMPSRTFCSNACWRRFADIVRRYWVSGAAGSCARDDLSHRGLDLGLVRKSVLCRHHAVFELGCCRRIEDDRRCDDACRHRARWFGARMDRPHASAHPWRYRGRRHQSSLRRSRAWVLD